MVQVLPTPSVMAGLVPAIHVLLRTRSKTWMPGTSPGMTEERDSRDNRSLGLRVRRSSMTASKVQHLAN